MKHHTKIQIVPKKAPRRRKKAKPKNILPKVLGSFFTRLFAAFFSYALKAVGAGAITGVSVTTSLVIAGLMGVATVFEYMTRTVMVRGEITPKDIDEAFVKTEARMDG